MAEIIDGLVDPGSKDGNATTATETTEKEAKPWKVLELLGTTEDLPLENVLSQFASYNYNFTLAILTVDEINFPDSTYKKVGPTNIILQSGGGLPVYTEAWSDKVAGGDRFFIENVVINHVIAPSFKYRQTDACDFTFQILEPYSMGTLFLKLQEQAVLAGYPSYQEAPFVLMIDFVGYDDSGNILSSRVGKQSARRMYPLKLSEVIFNVSERGSVYDVKATPWEQQAWFESNQSIPADMTLAGRTVKEMLETGAQSLTTLMNTSISDDAKKIGKKQHNEYVIIFPKQTASKDQKLLGSTPSDKPQGANQFSGGGSRDISTQELEYFSSLRGDVSTPLPGNLNDELQKLGGIAVKRTAYGDAIREYSNDPANTNFIGDLVINDSYLNPGPQPFAVQAFVADENKMFVRRNYISSSDNVRTKTWATGSRIQDIIEEVILSSEYGKKVQSQAPDDNGFINFFKIQVNVYVLPYSPHHIELTGQLSKVFVYKIVPYKVHHSHFARSKAAGIGYKLQKENAVKEYNYMYTGYNDDIIDLELKFDTGFYTSLSNQSGTGKAGSKDRNADTLHQSPEDRYTMQTLSPADTEAFSLAGNVQVQSNHINSTGNNGGGSISTPTISFARDMNDSLLNALSALTTLRLTIWGDPYFLGDSGFGNYHAGAGQNFNINADGSLDYEYAEVGILLNFNTPFDIENEGFVKLNPTKQSKPLGSFSGLYKVDTCISTFDAGRFTQELSLTRRTNQPDDLANKGVTTPTSADTAFIVNEKETSNTEGPVSGP
jgi:hypothetical protein